MKLFLLVCFGLQLWADTTGVLWSRAIPFSAAIVAGATIGQVKQAQTYWRSSTAWYLNNGDDLRYAAGADKFGHAFAAYAITVLVREGMLWSGVDTTTSVWIAAAVATAHQLLVEYRDATSIASDRVYYPYLGWSWGDVAANIAGALLPVAQHYWGRQMPLLSMLRYKFSFRPSDKVRNGFYNSLLDDYESQYHWMSVPLNAVLPFNKAWWGRFFGIGLGHSVREIVRAPGDYTYNGKQEIWLTLDYNLEAIETTCDVLRQVLRVVNMIRLPAPCIRFTPSVAVFGFRW